MAHPPSNRRKLIAIVLFAIAATLAIVVAALELGAHSIALAVLAFVIAVFLLLLIFITARRSVD